MKKVKTNNYIPDQIVHSWEGQFRFNKERNGKPGLRSPQIGALHALMAHSEESEDSAIVVMPTGTGKTETMLAYTVANMCKKVFVIVPSDALRGQTYRKFKGLGLLKELGVIPESLVLPKVLMVKSSLSDEEWKRSIEENNVIITTMSLAASISHNVRLLLQKYITTLFVDEAHHSQAETWNSFISLFPPRNVILFTATPFRNDGKKIQGKIVFNFQLKKAQEQGYYKEIKYYPIIKYNQEAADKAIAQKAVEILKEDLKNGYDHIIMARCKTKKRADEIIKVYEQYTEFSPVLVYSGMPKARTILKSILKREHRIIVCVNMLGEGYDLPQLKIAAIHDDKQSLAVTLQFIGRFTRTKANLGQASFITNIAYPPIANEINSLYQSDADWNYILPRISEKATLKKQSLSEFLQDFKGNLNEEISLENIRPAFSAEVFTTSSLTTNFSNWEDGVNNLDKYDYKMHTTSNDTLVIVLGKQSTVQWGDTQIVKNLNWDIIIVYFDAKQKRIYLNSSMKFKGENFVKSIFNNPIKVCGNNIYRVFANIDRLRLYNVGARLQGKDISFQSFVGQSVQDGLDLLTQGKLLKNNIYGIGFKNGERTTVGCSSNGKIWSCERGDLLHFKKWCNTIGKILFDETINPDIVLQNTLKEEKLSVLPNIYPLSIDWNPELYKHYTQILKFGKDKVYFDDIEFSVDPETKVGADIVFTMILEDKQSKFRLTIDKNKNKCHYEQLSGEQLSFLTGSGEERTFESFFDEQPLTIFYADNSISYGVNLCKPKNKAEEIPGEYINTMKWDGVDLRKESQKVAPYITDSIQHYMVKNIMEAYDYLINDDGSGEIADLVGINNSDDVIDITLYHLKYAKEGKVSQSIENLYQVCGQAQKSIRWKYHNGDKVFNHLLKRDEKWIHDGKSSRILKGTSTDLVKLREEATNRKEIRYHVVIVQPGMSKSNCTHEMKVLLGSTLQVLKQMANIDCKVICSI